MTVSSTRRPYRDRPDVVVRPSRAEVARARAQADLSPAARESAGSVGANPMAGADTAAGTNVAATITLAVVGGMRHAISGVLWSYSAAPTGGRLTISNGGATALDIDITGSGPGVLAFDPAKLGDTGASVVVTLAAGGAAVVGKVTLLGRWLEWRP
jgi:hypothetical protein